MKLILLIAVTIVFLTASAQDKIELNNQDGIYISYELTKISENEKKEKYVVSIKAENRNDFDVYYAIPLTKTTTGAYELNSIESKKFARVSVRNATGLFGSGKDLVGQQTKITTNDNYILFTIPKGQFITGEDEFSVKKGEKPILTNTFLKAIKGLDFFDIAISEGVVNGDWVSDCGKFTMTLALTKNPAGEIMIEQSVNGKKFIWKKTNANSFQKFPGGNGALSFNKANNTFHYSLDDGVSCIWTKK